MWLPILLLTVMASGSACPYFCQCRSPVIECHGLVPKLSDLDELPLNFTELRINGIECKQLQPYIGRMPTSTFLQRLRVIEVTNSSDLSNNSYLNWGKQNSKGVDVLVLPNVLVLNVSYNKLTDLPWHYPFSKNNTIQLRTLDAGYNQIDSIASMDSKQTPQLNWLSLANNNLDYISPNNFKYLELLEYLDVSYNVLHTLEGIFDSLRSLQRLNVAGNKLEHVQSDWFQNLSKLVQLDISRNKMTFVPADTLQPLASLSVFKLAENPLIERDLSLLLGTGRRLEAVDASRIGLIRVPAALTHSVRTLKLAGNQLTSINSGDLDSYPLLKSLILSDNRLMIIEEDALGRLDNLQELILSGNILPTIPKSLPNGLKIFDLRQNAISILKVNDLQGLYVLEELNLSGNVINLIEEGSFRQLPQLRSLDISDNPIKKLPSDTLNGPTNLKILRMSGLMSLIIEENQNHDTAFPILSPERLVTLDISRSPVLAALLLADNAALSACKSLEELNLSYTNVSAMRPDVAYVLPQLRKLNLIGNKWNCSADQFWLGEWLRQHQPSMKLSTRCTAPLELESKLLEELPNPSNIQIATTKNVKVTTNSTTLSTTEDKESNRNYGIEHKNKFKTSNKINNLVKFPSISKDSINSHLTTQDSLSTNNASQTDFTTLSPRSTVLTKPPLRVENLQVENIYEEYRSHISPMTSKDKKLISAISEEDFPNFSTTSASQIYESKVKNYEPLSLSTQSTNINAKNKQDEKKHISISSSTAAFTSKVNSIVTEEKLFTTSVNYAETTMTDTSLTDPVTTINMNVISTSTDSPQRIDEGNSSTIHDKRQQHDIMKIDKSLIIDHNSSMEDANPKKRGENKVISDLSHSNLLFSNEESLPNVVSNSFAEELSSQATESGARISESLASGAHPGMLVLLGAAIGTAVALTVVLSRRATIKRRDRQYQRHENIEVHALTPTTELW